MNLLNRGKDFLLLVRLGDNGDQPKGQDISRKKMNSLILSCPWIGQ